MTESNTVLQLGMAIGNGMREYAVHTLQFYENSSKHPKKITLLFYINNVIFDTGWTLYCIRSYLNAQRCTEPPENLIFQVVT